MNPLSRVTCLGIGQLLSDEGRDRPDVLFIEGENPAAGALPGRREWFFHLYVTSPQRLQCPPAGRRIHDV